jgi:hypothetical protein
MNERDYENGYRMAATSILQSCLSALDYKGDSAQRSAWILERESAISTLRRVCAEFGDNDWENNLHLSDIIDKHLARYLEKD